MYVKWLNTNNHCEKPDFFCFSDGSYRNWKCHEIFGCLEAIWGVLGLIYGKCCSPPGSNRVKGYSEKEYYEKNYVYMKTMYPSVRDNSKIYE